MSTQAGEQIDLFHKLLDQLAYHGQLSLLLDAVAIAWPLIKNSRNVTSWAIEAFSAQAADYVIFDFMEQHTVTAADNPELNEMCCCTFEIHRTLKLSPDADLARKKNTLSTK